MWNTKSRPRLPKKKKLVKSRRASGSDAPSPFQLNSHLRGVIKSRDNLSGRARVVGFRLGLCRYRCQNSMECEEVESASIQRLRMRGLQWQLHSCDDDGWRLSRKGER